MKLNDEQQQCRETVLESIANLTDRVENIEQSMSWQREVCDWQITRSCKEAESPELAQITATKNIKDLSPYARAMKEGLVGKLVRVFTADEGVRHPVAYRAEATLEVITESYIIVTVDKGEEHEFVEIIPMHQISSIDTISPLEEKD